MATTFIKNRKDQRIALIVEQPAQPIGLAFVMHGLGGFKEQPHIKAMAQVLLKNGYTTVRFDTSNSFGESDGQFENATATNYFEDLVDVIAWARNESWYQQPYILVGHSLGGFCTGLYAEKYPEEN